MQLLCSHYFFDFWNQFQNIHNLSRISFETGFEKSSEILNIFKPVSKVVRPASSQSDFWNQFENIRHFWVIFRNQFQKSVCLSHS